MLFKIYVEQDHYILKLCAHDLAKRKNLLVLSERTMVLCVHMSLSALAGSKTQAHGIPYYLFSLSSLLSGAVCIQGLPTAANLQAKGDVQHQIKYQNPS